MTRLGIVGGAERFHAKAFTGILNAKDEAAWQEAGFPPYESRPVPQARIVAICDQNLQAAQEIAGMVPGVELVTDRPEELLGQVDGVLICDDASEQHQKRALLFLEAGLPTFIDKPLSRDPGEAEALLTLAEQHGAPVMSCSALRYSAELAALDLAGLGEILTAVAVGSNELVFYGVHPCELLHTVLGPGVRSVRNCGAPGQNHVFLDYADGRSGVLIVREDLAYTFRLTLLGTEGSAHLVIADAGAFYRNMLEQFIVMVRTGEMPIPAASTLEIIRILDAAARSLATGQTVGLPQ